LDSLGIATVLAPLPRPVPAAECFAGPELHDLTWQGRKIAGAAQRRNRRGLLIQGSVQPPQPGPAKMDWQTALCHAGSASWGIEWTALDLSPTQERHVRERVEAKYGRPEYNCRR
jgi:lipoate-protein ligase A